jgi:hypothetical protein
VSKALGDVLADCSGKSWSWGWKTGIKVGEEAVDLAVFLVEGCVVWEFETGESVGES